MSRSFLKPLFVILASNLVGVAAHASVSTSCTPPLDLAIERAAVAGRLEDRIQRIVSDQVLLGLVASVESKFSVKCSVPAESGIHWMCLAGPQCGYAFEVTCGNAVPRPCDTMFSFKVRGFDNGDKNNLTYFEMEPQNLP